MLSSSSLATFKLPNAHSRPHVVQQSDITTRIHSTRSIRSKIPLQVTRELVVDSRPSRKYYSHSTDECLLHDAFEAARRVTVRSAAKESKLSKIAFLFLVRGEIPFEPLWRRFFAGHEQRYSLYVHAAPNFPFPRSSFFFGQQIPSQRVECLSRSLADAVRRLVAMALVDVENYNAWSVNVCESAIPLRSFDDTYRYLVRSRHSFVQSFQPVSKYWGAVPRFKVSSPRTFDAQNTNASFLHKIAALTEDSFYGQHYNTAFRKFGVVHCAHNDVPGAPCFLFARKFHPSSLDVVMEWL